MIWWTSLLVLWLLITSVPVQPEGIFSCDKDIHYQPNSMILAKQSIRAGAKLLIKLSVNVMKDCYYACCNVTLCTDVLYRSKAPKACFLFNCFPEAVCIYTPHNNYDVFTTSLRNAHRREVRLGDRCSTQTVCKTNKSVCSDGVCVCSLGWIKKSHQCVPSVCRLQDIQFQCDDSSACVAIYNQCNGIKDCTDGSDENDCLTDTLSSGHKLPTYKEQTNSNVGTQISSAPAANRTVMSVFHPVSSKSEQQDVHSDSQQLHDQEGAFRPYHLRAVSPKSNHPSPLYSYINLPSLNSFYPVYPDTEGQESEEDWLPNSSDNVVSLHHQIMQQIQGDAPAYLSTSRYRHDLPYRQQSFPPVSDDTLSAAPTAAGYRRHWWNRPLPGRLYSPNSQGSLYHASYPTANAFQQTGFADEDGDYFNPYSQAGRFNGYDSRPHNNHLFRMKSEFRENARVSSPPRYVPLSIPESGRPSVRSRNLKVKNNHLSGAETHTVVGDSQQQPSPNITIKSSSVTRATEPARDHTMGYSSVLFLTLSASLLSCFLGFVVAEYCRRRHKRQFIRRPYRSVSTAATPASLRGFHRLNSLSNGLLPASNKFCTFSRRDACGVNRCGDLEESKALCDDLAL